VKIFSGGEFAQLVREHKLYGTRAMGQATMRSMLATSVVSQVQNNPNLARNHQQSTDSVSQPKTLHNVFN